MRTAEIKRRFLAHFEANGHAVVPSAPLPAIDDPNLLFVNAGMVQFVPYFLGQRTPPWKRATSVQKCIRTPDIDEVGKTSRHGTFFQMNGNFSFGDYFKEGAITLAWDLVTKSVDEGGFGLDPERIWATVYLDDDEAFDIWHHKIGLPKERIVRRGKADNYWSMGIPGPCGPCSEIYLDRGPEYGREGGPEVDEDRYMEFWNLVFMQNERGPGTDKENYPILGELPAKNIDTGMGLERMASILQGVDNIYEIDEIKPILNKAAELTGKQYGARSGHLASESHPDDVRLRVIADHVRTSLMLIADGVTPSNEGRGYVLRRIMRRAIRAMRLLGWQGRALPELLPVARDCMAPSYPEVVSDFERIASYAYAEEEAFLSTLRAGTTILDTAVAETKRAGGTRLTGEQAFQLHDTYGFPIDLTLEIAGEQGLSVDEEGFRRLMGEQRSRAKADAQARKTGHVDLSAYRAVLESGGPVEFTGYEETRRESRLRALLSGSGTGLSGAGVGDTVELVLDATPFYAEGGGQQPDQGIITVGGGSVEVFDVQQPIPGLIVHRGRVVEGEIRRGETGYAEIDVLRRKAISRAHTATHLVHTAMRNFLGESATQAGSLNAPGRLRFDFNTPGAVSPSVLHDIEQQVNEVLMSDLDVHAFITSLEEARKLGAMALFGEKYGDEVRVVEVGDYARELCGGTHAARSGQLGLVKIVQESSIGSGVRRVEALVGMDAFGYLAREHVLVSRLAELYRVPGDQVADRVEQTVAQLREAEKELEKLRAQLVLANVGALVAGARDVGGVSFVGVEAPEGTGGNEVRTLAQEIRGRMPADRPGVAAVTARSGGKASLIVATNPAARDRGLSAADLVKGALSGRGGGNAELAQGGGAPAGDAPSLLAAVEKAIANS
ncbi:alanine--tRNA ligase [Planosporangium mesophilum]|uniref:Alanine--tRNA ligase n=1 Tax=Planosporangium mesophilum TaxID=689768 RepID=A0A8J3TEH6_9ACTN|nr:alanine--tRNA ligase [Planosporangium mesophilum]NJC85202.1 alanine--tRNA ligase [Planosporangium mesophilum]GII24347.1 alanine--tRNA ligase [Planosporangium mesophilum]